MPKWIITDTDRATRETHRRLVEADTQQRAVRLVGRGLFVERAERLPERTRLWRRMFRWLCILSLLLAIGFAALWIRSYYRHDIVEFSSLDLGPPPVHTIRNLQSNCGLLLNSFPRAPRCRQNRHSPHNT